MILKKENQIKSEFRKSLREKLKTYPKPQADTLVQFIRGLQYNKGVKTYS